MMLRLLSAAPVLALSLAVLAAFTALAAAPAAAQQGVISAATSPFPNFESGPTHPLLLSEDGLLLCVLNTPDNRLEVYTTGVTGPAGGKLNLVASFFTGLEPVSLTRHPDDPNVLFVANLLSDTVAVVDLGTRRVRTIVDVGDEPQDVVVAGGKVFVATARAPLAPGLIEPGEQLENAVVVFDAAAPHDVLARIPLSAHKPRALAVSGDRVWVVPQNSGNGTATLDQVQTDNMGLEQLDIDAFDPAFDVNPGLLAPEFSVQPYVNFNFLVPNNGWIVPQTGRIAFWWEFPAKLPNLVDHDLFAIDVETLALLGTPVSGVGTTLLSVEVDPFSRDLWIANTDARNRTRFEPSLTGSAFDNRVTLVAPEAIGGGSDGDAVRHLSLAPPFTQQHHAQPAPIAFYDGAFGRRAYVAALGTASVVVIDRDAEAVLDEVAVGAVPVGLAVDSVHDRFYVLSRVEKQVTAYSIGADHRRVGQPKALAYDPEPPAVDVGRIHLYDARTPSGAGTGNMSCASCHVFGHGDVLAWDLGNPAGGLGWAFPDMQTGVLGNDGLPATDPDNFMTHPLKGPMVTQSLRGLGEVNGPPLHWRGDRRFFQMFRGAFEGLLGGTGISPTEMQAYAGFVRSMVFPPNPYQPKDRRYVDAAGRGVDLFGLNPEVPGKVYNNLVPGNPTCIDCHKADFVGETDFSGAQATINFDAETQLFNTPTLRGAYEKQFRHLTGFGLVHDGTIGTVADFLDASLGGMEAFPNLNDTDRADLTALVLAWDSGLAPLVGGQFAGDAGNVAGLTSWLALARAQAAPGVDDLDVVGKAHLNAGPLSGIEIGLLWLPDGNDETAGNAGAAGRAGQWLADFDVTVDDATLLTAIEQGAVDVLFTAVPPGQGRRLGIDRDEDGLLDGVERGIGTRGFDPDSDDDGFGDGREVVDGTDPLDAADQPGPDGVPPTVVEVLVTDAFADTAGLRVVLDRPGTLEVAVSPSSNGAPLIFADPSLRAVHDLVLSGLPAGADLDVAVTATDADGEQGVGGASFPTAPPLIHVTSVEMSVVTSEPWKLRATVRVADHEGQPVAGLRVRGVWTGDTGTTFWFPARTTNAGGAAFFTTDTFTPGGPTTVGFSVAYLGEDSDTADPFYVGEGGDDMADQTFFYNQSANAANYDTFSIP